MVMRNKNNIEVTVNELTTRGIDNSEMGNMEASTSPNHYQNPSVSPSFAPNIMLDFDGSNPNGLGIIDVMPVCLELNSLGSLSQEVEMRPQLINKLQLWVYYGGI